MSESKENNPGRMSALHLAALRGDVNHVRQLLDEGANPHALNSDKQPPLFNTLERAGIESPEKIAAREQAFRLLWNATDADTRISQDAEGNTVLQLMAVYGFDKLVPEVLQQAPELASRYMKTTGEYPIHTAILNNQLDVAEALFDIDTATAGYKTFKLQSPLHYAAHYGSEAMVLLCCEHHRQHARDIDEHDRAGKTALAYAKQRNHTGIADYLIDQGADETRVNSRTESSSRSTF